MPKWLFAVAVIVFVLVGWVTGVRLASPKRHGLRDYHQSWLQHPEDHGLKFDATFCLEGKVPCLFVVPDPNAAPAKRGKIIREQLAKQGVMLSPYGTISGTLVLLHGRHGRKENLLPVAEPMGSFGGSASLRLM